MARASRRALKQRSATGPKPAESPKSRRARTDNLEWLLGTSESLVAQRIRQS